jgi:hypothetical protein
MRQALVTQQMALVEASDLRRSLRPSEAAAAPMFGGRDA